MSLTSRARGAFAVLGVVACATVVAGPADAASKPAWTTNCTALNHRYPHGVGKAKAHDHVSSGTPVTSFLRSNKLYKQAMSYNRGLDRDHDGIACEKA